MYIEVLLNVAYISSPMVLAIFGHFWRILFTEFLDLDLDVCKSIHYVGMPISSFDLILTFACKLTLMPTQTRLSNNRAIGRSSGGPLLQWEVNIIFFEYYYWLSSIRFIQLLVHKSVITGKCQKTAR